MLGGSDLHDDIVDDGGENYLLQVQDGFDNVRHVICEIIVVCGKDEVVGEDSKQELHNQPIVSMLQVA